METEVRIVIIFKRMYWLSSGKRDPPWCRKCPRLWYECHMGVHVRKYSSSYELENCAFLFYIGYLLKGSKKWIKSLIYSCVSCTVYKFKGNNNMQKFRVWSSLVIQWVKDPALSLLWHVFAPSSQNFSILQAQPKNFRINAYIGFIIITEFYNHRIRIP